MPDLLDIYHLSCRIQLPDEISAGSFDTKGDIMSQIKTPVEVIDDAVESMQSDIRFMKSRVAVLKSGKVRRLLAKLLQPLIYAVGDAGRVYASVNYGKPEIVISMYGLDSFKQRELVWVLEFLTQETDKLNGEMRTNDYPAAVNRDFNFTTDKWEARITAYVRSDSETCRKVVIGTEMVEQHKYQIVCD